MKKTYLFVGGPWDGRREETDGMPYMRIATMRPMKMLTSFEETTPDPSDFSADIHSYRLDRFASGDERYSVYMHAETIPQGGGMKALIDGYRQPPSTEPPPEDPAKTRAAMERLVSRLEHIKGQRTPEYLRDEPSVA